FILKDARYEFSFGNCAPVRHLMFLSEDGQKALQGSDFETARAAYLSVNDGNVYDEYWFGWKIDPLTTHTITAAAAAGGRILPDGNIVVAQGNDQTFVFTPNEGYQIQSVEVDGNDVAWEALQGADMQTREGADPIQTGQPGTYSFRNIQENHEIEVSFEPLPGVGEDPGTGDNQPDDKKPGGENEAGGADSTGGENSGENGGRLENPDKETTPAEAVAVAAVEEAAQSENTQPAAVEAGGTEMPAVQNGQNQAAADKPAAPEDTQGKEPKTGDAAHVEVYATIAMIAGLAYLLLYFMEEGRGMTEREKEVFVAAFIRWAKKGGTFRRCCALAAIFCILVYYHAAGKYAGIGKEDRTPALNGR
ncbi:MAG: hypothetical protein K2O15_04435, partial [Lachnospiraceae bacterium]|nr:hypothetical protein [Lachnospiraceae bacterium]